MGVKEAHTAAVARTADLLEKLRMQYAFVGSSALAAWLGESADGGAIEVLVLMSPEQKNNVAMMASNRGFRVDRDEVLRSEELDLIPIHAIVDGTEVPVYVLVASNALYGTMVASAREVTLEGTPIRVVSSEDLALLLRVDGGEAAAFRSKRLESLPSFDRKLFNRKVRAVGLGELVVTE